VRGSLELGDKQRKRPAPQDGIRPFQSQPLDQRDTESESNLGNLPTLGLLGTMTVPRLLDGEEKNPLVSLRIPVSWV
jgi:hypothetical protein